VTVLHTIQKQCLVLIFVSNLLLLLSRHTSSHGLLFGVREQHTMTRDNLEEKLQLLLIRSSWVRLRQYTCMTATPRSTWSLTIAIPCTKAAAVWKSSSSSQVAGSALRKPSCKPSFWKKRHVLVDAINHFMPSWSPEMAWLASVGHFTGDSSPTWCGMRWAFASSRPPWPGIKERENNKLLSKRYHRCLCSLDRAALVTSL